MKANRPNSSAPDAEESQSVDLYLYRAFAEGALQALRVALVAEILVPGSEFAAAPAHNSSQSKAI